MITFHTWSLDSPTIGVEGSEHWQDGGTNVRFGRLSPRRSINLFTTTLTPGAFFVEGVGVRGADVVGFENLFDHVESPTARGGATV
jgi:hypothetical protein